MLNFPQLGNLQSFTAKLKSKLPSPSLDTLTVSDPPISYSCHLELIESTLKRVAEGTKCLYKVKSKSAHKQVTLSGKEKAPTPPKRKRVTFDRPSKKMKIKQVSLSTYLVKI